VFQSPPIDIPVASTISPTPSEYPCHESIVSHGSCERVASIDSAAMLATIVDLDCKLCCCPLTMAEVIAATDTVKIPTAIIASRSARPLRGIGCNVNGCIVKVKSNLCEHQSSLDVYIFIYYEMKI
jgi:hypothetical protein